MSVKISVDGTGVAENSTGIPFLDHMLDVSNFNLEPSFDFVDLSILSCFFNLGFAVRSCRRQLEFLFQVF